MIIDIFIIHFVLIGAVIQRDNVSNSIPLLNDDLNENPDINIFDCVTNLCIEDRVKCNEARTSCICNPLYGTINNGPFCNYNRKYQLIAFLLEVLLGFGGGHFYTERYIQASFKLAAFIIGIAIIFAYPKIIKHMSHNCDCEMSLLFISIFMYCYTLGMASWYILDAVYYGNNFYYDGHNFSLIEW